MNDAPRAPEYEDIGPSSQILAGLALVLLALLVGLALLVDHSPLRVDVDVSAAVIGFFPAWATRLFDTLGTLPVIGVVAAVAAVASWLRRRPGAAVSFVVGVCAEAAVTLVKVVVDRPRPAGSGTVGDFITVASFPSGHTVRAVVIAALLVAAFAPRFGAARWLAIAAAAAFAGLVGLARIASGEHWPTDVLGGVFLGASWACISLIVGERFANVRVLTRGSGAPPPGRPR
jgi:undecaprenyl-diphosphatase